MSEDCHLTEKICLSYVEKNFWAAESQSNVKSNIIVPHLEQLDQYSNNFKIAKNLICILPQKDCFFFTNCSFFNYLKIIRYTEDEIERKFNSQLNANSNTMILYPDGFNAVIIITLPKSENDSLHDLHLKADANVKAYQTLHRHCLIGGDKLMVISVIGAFYHKKVDPKYCSKCYQQLTIFSDDIENLGLWWKKLKVMMEQTTSKYSMGEVDEVQFRRKIASLLVVMGALTDDRFPTLFASDDERIDKMLLNEAQRDVLLDPLPKKIIKG